MDLQAIEFGASDAAKANIDKLRAGARAVVTGQQVVLFGGPVLTPIVGTLLWSAGIVAVCTAPMVIGYRKASMR